MSLEEEMLAWLHEARKTGGAQGAEKQVHRFLQLARREGYVVCMKRNEGTLRLATTSDAEWEAYEDTIPRRQFPIRRTVTETRVLRLPDSVALFAAVRNDILMFYNDEVSAAAGGSITTVTRLTKRDVEAIADLLANPTVARLVEE